MSSNLTLTAIYNSNTPSTPSDECRTTARGLTHATLRKHVYLAENFLAFARDHGLVHIGAADGAFCRMVRASWKVGQRTAVTKTGWLRGFFKFCVENEWLAKKPATVLKSKKVTANPRVPFGGTEIRNILSKRKTTANLPSFSSCAIRACVLEMHRSSRPHIFLITVSSSERRKPNACQRKNPRFLGISSQSHSPTRWVFFVRGDSVSMHTCADLWRRGERCTGPSPPFPAQFGR